MDKHAYRVEGSTVNGVLDHLDGGVVARLDGDVGRHGQLGNADGARVGVAAGAEDLEGRVEGLGHVVGTVVRAVCPETDVDVNVGRGVALEPAGLEGDGAASRGPVGAVLGHVDAAT